MAQGCCNKQVEWICAPNEPEYGVGQIHLYSVCVPSMRLLLLSYHGSKCSISPAPVKDKVPTMVLGARSLPLSTLGDFSFLRYGLSSGQFLQPPKNCNYHEEVPGSKLWYYQVLMDKSHPIKPSPAFLKQLWVTQAV
jgi:hypothetical protein